MILFRLLLTLGIILAAWTPSQAANAPKPNIIFILADDLGYGDLGCYGQKKIQTPCLDRMAADGMRFTQFYAGSTVCAPSRSVLMTGQHTGHCWVRGNAGKNNAQGQILRAQDVTVAKVLRDAGYATALIGKWGLGEPGSSGIPTKQDFDYFFGYLSQFHAHNYYPAFLWRGEERVPLKNEVPPGNVGYGYAEFGQGWATKRVEYSHDLFAADALKWVERNRGQPFFLYLAVTTPHANNEGTRGTGNGQEVPDHGIYKDKDWTDQNKGQAAMITRMDADIGRLLAKLKQLGLDERTLVLFSSDNGPHKEGGNDPEFFDANGPLRGMKRDLYDGGIRVPFIARWPGRIKAGVVSNHVGYFGDFMATAAELAGAEPPPTLDSISFAPTLLGRPERQKRHDYLYWEFHERGFAQAVRLGDWKAIRFGTKKPVELYNIKNDPGEERDVAAQNPEVVAKVEAILKTARTDSEYFPIREFAPKKATAKKKP
ncbi:MAG: arylsulfatase [Verrucomicrobia bacterium]|nr:arylsulfatase [Verrucomicrobiota bacterium]